ncbi:MAG: DUF1704 domain-containing protein [Bdellovibrionales bacterium]|nr:DUF1704 domain-containing protein [Bdellovibrionales bacterium]
MNEILNLYSETSKALRKASDGINLFSYINPLNGEDLYFEFTKNTNLKFSVFDFIYKEISVDINSIRDEVNKIQIPAQIPELQTILENKVADIKKQLTLLDYRGDPDKFSEASVEAYGRPTQHNLNVAMRILISFEPEQHQETHTAQELKDALEKAFIELNLKNWIVVLSDTCRQTFVSGREDFDGGGMVSISSKRMFSANEIQRLPIHEVKVHALRRDNGLKQPVDIFGTGLTGYINTEEGLALNAEKLTGTSCSTSFRRYAARTLAVDALLNGFSLNAIYDMLRDYGIDHADSFETVKRTARGGGFTKDHVYLDGYKRVKKYFRSGKNPDPLFVGKVGIDDIDLVNTLLEKSYLKPPNQIPDFFRNVSTSSIKNAS